MLTPHWWAINAFVLLSIPVCLVMGSWQLARFEDRVESHQVRQERSADEAASRTEPLADLLPLTGDTVGRYARVTGRYDTEHRFLVPGRRLDGRDGFHALALLRTDDGRALPVVRGWLPGEADPGRVPPLPEGEVTVVGPVQAPESESSPGAHTGALPAGQVGIISAATLVNLVPYDVYDAWITVQRPQEPMKAVPAVAPEGTGLDLKAFQNLGYTAQWFVFAGFVLFMWYRLFRREAEAARDRALGIDPEPGPLTTPGPAPEDVPEPTAASGTLDAPAPESPRNTAGGTAR
nr:SURF1 family protein [Streptomyces taklimakanensis]